MSAEERKNPWAITSEDRELMETLKAGDQVWCYSSSRWSHKWEKRNVVKVTPKRVCLFGPRSIFTKAGSEWGSASSYPMEIRPIVEWRTALIQAEKQADLDNAMRKNRINAMTGQSSFSGLDAAAVGRIWDAFIAEHRKAGNSLGDRLAEDDKRHIERAHAIDRDISDDPIK